MKESLKPIEPGCLAIYRFEHYFGIVEVGEKITEGYTWWSRWSCVCGSIIHNCHWAVSNHPVIGVRAACRTSLTRIDPDEDSKRLFEKEPIAGDMEDDYVKELVLDNS